MCNLFINLVFLLYLTGRKRGAGPDWPLCHRIFERKIAHANPLGSNTCAPVLCCLLPFSLIRVRSIRALCNIFHLSGSRSASALWSRSCQHKSYLMILWLPAAFAPWIFAAVHWILTSVIKQWHYCACTNSQQKAASQRVLIQLGRKSCMSSLWKGSTITSCRVFFFFFLVQSCDFWVKEHSVYCACTVPWDSSTDRTKITGIWASLRQLHKSVPWTLARSSLIPDNGLSDLCCTRGCGSGNIQDIHMIGQKSGSLRCENHLGLFVCVKRDLSSHCSLSSSSLRGSSLTIVYSLKVANVLRSSRSELKP